MRPSVAGGLANCLIQARSEWVIDWRYDGTSGPKRRSDYVACSRVERVLQGFVIKFYVFWRTIAVFPKARLQCTGSENKFLVDLAIHGEITRILHWDVLAIVQRTVAAATTKGFDDLGLEYDPLVYEPKPLLHRQLMPN